MPSYTYMNCPLGSLAKLIQSLNGSGSPPKVFVNPEFVELEANDFWIECGLLVHKMHTLAWRLQINILDRSTPIHARLEAFFTLVNNNKVKFHYLQHWRRFQRLTTKFRFNFSASFLQQESYPQMQTIGHKLECGTVCGWKQWKVMSLYNSCPMTARWHFVFNSGSPSLPRILCDVIYLGCQRPGGLFYNRWSLCLSFSMGVNGRTRRIRSSLNICYIRVLSMLCYLACK